MATPKRQNHSQAASTSEDELRRYYYEQQQNGPTIDNFNFSSPSPHHNASANQIVDSNEPSSPLMLRRNSSFEIVTNNNDGDENFINTNLELPIPKRKNSSPKPYSESNNLDLILSPTPEIPSLSNERKVVQKRSFLRNLFIFTEFPWGVWFILVNEFCERFSFYGFKAILALYLKNYLMFDKEMATAIVHAFSFVFQLFFLHFFYLFFPVFFAYFTPLFGGFLADNVMGKYWTIFSLSIVYCIGQIFISVTAIPGVTGSPPHWWGIAIGLFLVAIGTGGIKPCVSSMGGDQFQPSQTEHITAFFSIFYLLINLGSTLSSFLTPLLRNYFGYAVAFAVPAVLLLFASFIFVIGKKLYICVPPSRDVVLIKVLRVLFFGVKHVKSVEYQKVDHWLDRAQAGGVVKQDIEDVKCVWRVIPILIPITIFWSLFDQHSSRWVFQSEMMDLQVGPFHFTADQITTLNPLLIIILVPLFDRVIYKWIDCTIIKLTPLRKIGLGFLFTFASFIATAILQIFVELYPEQVNVSFQLIQYVLLCIGEVMVSVTGLEFAYSQAPKSMKSVMQSLYLLSVAMGNVIVVLVALIPIPNFAFKQVFEFEFFSVLMLGGFLVFLVLAMNYQYREVSTDEKEMEKRDVIEMESLMHHEEVLQDGQEDMIQEEEEMEYKESPYYNMKKQREKGQLVLQQSFDHEDE